MYEKLEKNDIELFKKQLLLERNDIQEESKTIDDVVALIEEISIERTFIDSDGEKVTSILGMFFQSAIAKEHIECLRAYWAYRKLIGRDGPNGSYPLGYYDDFFIGKEYITSEGYQFIEKRCSETKLIRDNAILLAKNKYSEEDLISIKDFFNTKKNQNGKQNLFNKQKFFILIFLYIQIRMKKLN